MAHPIHLLELLDMTTLQINPAAIKFGSTTLESDKFIVTCETVNDQQSVVMVDLQGGNAVTRRPISAEAAIMNPVSKVRHLWALFCHHVCLLPTGEPPCALPVS
jgi:clathrin heavy chain